MENLAKVANGRQHKDSQSLVVEGDGPFQERTPSLQLKSSGSMEMECGCDGCPSCSEASQQAEEQMDEQSVSDTGPLGGAGQILEKAMALHEEEGNDKEVADLEKALKYLEELDGKEGEPEVQGILQGLEGAAKGDPEPMKKQADGATEKQPVQRFAFAIPAVVIGAEALYALGAAAVALTGAYILSQTRVEPISIPMPMTRSRDRGRGRRIRCTKRPNGGQNPPAHCPDRVYGTGSSRGEAQRNAKNSAPEECRRFYGHCNWVR